MYIAGHQAVVGMGLHGHMYVRTMLMEFSFPNSSLRYCLLIIIPLYKCNHFTIWILYLTVTVMM